MDDGLDKAIDDAFEEVGEVDETIDESAPDEVETEESEADEEEDGESESEDSDIEPKVEEELEPEPELELEPINPPASFRAEAKEAFANAPRQVQEEISRVMLESQRYLTKVSQEAAELKRSTEGVYKAFEPYQERLRLAGQQPEQVVSTMLAWDSKFKEDPVNALVEAAQKTGVDLYGFAEQILGGGIQQPDPQIVETQQKIAELEKQIADRDSQQQQILQRSLESEADSFISETDTSGNLLRPYAQNEEVLQEMIHQIQVIKMANPNAAPRQILQEAYNRAVKLSDAVASQLKKAEQEKRSKKQKIELAKKAKKSITQVGGTASSSSKPKSIDDAIDAAFEELGY